MTTISGDEVITKLQTTIESIRAKSQKIARQSFSIQSHQQNGTTHMSELPRARRQPSISSQLDWSKLDDADKETLQDIVKVQQWLYSIKSTHNFQQFSGVVKELVRFIYAPPQSQWAQKPVSRNNQHQHQNNHQQSQSQSQPQSRLQSQPPLSNNTKSNSLHVQNTSNGSNSENKSSRNRRVEQNVDNEEEEEDAEFGDIDDQLGSNSNTNNGSQPGLIYVPLSDIPVPDNVQFLNGRWVPKNIDPDDDANALDNLSDFDDDDDDENDDENKEEKELSDQQNDDNDNSSVSSTTNGSKKSRSKRSSINSQSSRAKADTAGPSSRELGEFIVDESLIQALDEAQQQHNFSFLSSSLSRNYRSVIHDAAAVLHPELQLEWNLYQAEACDHQFAHLLPSIHQSSF